MEIDYLRKEKKVSKELQEKCTAKNFAFIVHKNINSKLDLFPDKLHPNKKGQGILKGTVTKFIDEYIWRFSQGDDVVIPNNDIPFPLNKTRNIEDVSFSSPLTNSNDTEIKDPQSFLKDIKPSIIGQLNINSLRNFSLQGFCDPYQFARNRNGCGIMLYIKEDIPSRVIEKKLRNNSEYFFFEINLRKKKWLFCYSYNPHKNSISTHIDFLRRELDLHSSNYENFILLGDFNSEMTDTNLKDFCCKLYNLKNLIKKPTCSKNPENPKTIDLMLTNRPRSFCNSDTLETGLSDFKKLTVTVLKTFFIKQSPKVISYWNYKSFSNDPFRTDLINEISSNGILEGDLIGFLDACKKSLDYQAPRKKKYTRANQVHLLTKEINKEIMTR